MPLYVPYCLVLPQDAQWALQLALYEAVLKNFEISRGKACSRRLLSTQRLPNLSSLALKYPLGAGMLVFMFVWHCVLVARLLSFPKTIFLSEIPKGTSAKARKSSSSSFQHVLCADPAGVASFFRAWYMCRGIGCKEVFLGVAVANQVAAPLWHGQVNFHLQSDTSHWLGTTTVTFLSQARCMFPGVVSSYSDDGDDGRQNATERLLTCLVSRQPRLGGSQSACSWLESSCEVRVYVGPLRDWAGRTGRRCVVLVARSGVSRVAGPTREKGSKQSVPLLAGPTQQRCRPLLRSTS